MHAHCLALTLWSAPRALAASPAAPWFAKLCLCCHQLNFCGLLPIPPRVCMHVSGGESLLAWERGKTLFNRGAHGGKAISNNVLFLQQQLCLTPVASAAHYLSSHLFLPPLPSIPSHTQAIVMKVWFMTVWVYAVWVTVLSQFEETKKKLQVPAHLCGITSRPGFAFNLVPVRFGEQKSVSDKKRQFSE